MPKTHRFPIYLSHLAIHRRLDFDAGNMRGRNVTYTKLDDGRLIARAALMFGTGAMSRFFAEDFRTNVEAGNVEYVVWSYSTPIAWLHKREGWIIPRESYSVSTSRHQFQARLGADGDAAYMAWSATRYDRAA